MKDLDPLCGKLTQHIAAITAYLEAVGLGALARIERDLGAIPERIQRAVDDLASEIWAGRREGSILTTYSDDEKDVWKQFRRELISDGMRSSFVHKYKPLIRKYLKELADRGELEELPPEEKQLAQAVLLDSAQLEDGSSGTTRLTASQATKTRRRTKRNPSKVHNVDAASESNVELDCRETKEWDEASGRQRDRPSSSGGDATCSTTLTRNESKSTKRDVPESSWTSKVTKWMEMDSLNLSTAPVLNMSIRPEALQPLAVPQEYQLCRREGEESALAFEATSGSSTEQPSNVKRLDGLDEDILKQKLYLDGNEDEEGQQRSGSDALYLSKGAKMEHAHDPLALKETSNARRQNDTNAEDEAPTVPRMIADGCAETGQPPNVPRESQTLHPSVPLQSTPNAYQSVPSSEAMSTEAADMSLDSPPSKRYVVKVPREKPSKTLHSYTAFTSPYTHHGKGVVKTCPRCDGRGTKMMMRQVGHMKHEYSTVCPVCWGVGKFDCCAKCGGKGKVPKTTKYSPTLVSYEDPCSDCDGMDLETGEKAICVWDI